MKTKTTLLWVFIIISMISTSALVTLVVVKPNFGTEPKPFPPENNFQQENNVGGDLLIDNLNLDEEQFELFRAEKMNHLSHVEPIFDSISNLRSALFAELQLANPDTAKVDFYVDQIAGLERTLQMEAVHHMLNLKTFLEPVQVDSLFAFFSRRMMPMHSTRHHQSGRRNNQHCR